MDLRSIWNQRTQERSFQALSTTASAMKDNVADLQAWHTNVWWTCERGLPDLKPAYTPQQQMENEKKLDALVTGLVHELKRLPSGTEERQAWQERLRPGLNEFARMALNFEQRHLDYIESCGMVEASLEFARMARRFDAQMSTEDIYQAGRNVMTANFMQLLLGLPVEVTPSVFAYSMLYPYTDNYLDDPNISRTTKLAFNHRFQQRLQGEAVRPANAHEANIGRLVEMIESQWDRSRYPLVYESLLAIHEAQVRSLGLVAPGFSPFEKDVIGVSFEKGGTSVLADGYLVAGWLTPQQARLMFGYGAFTQLMDDLEDIQQDLREQRATVFTQTAGHWPLDAVTSKLFHFGRVIFSDLSAFDPQAAARLGELIERGIDPVLLDIIGQNGKYYSKPYLRQMEQHMPFRFASLQKQRQKLEKKRVSFGSLIEAML